MNFAKKLIGTEEERAVSPVIGVILMVAITVILAAVIAAFVLDLGQTDANPSAGVSLSGDGSPYHITLNSLGTGTEAVYCSSTDASNYTAGSDGANEVGQTFDCDDDQTVVAVHENGNEAVVHNLD